MTWIEQPPDYDVVFKVSSKYPQNILLRIYEDNNLGERRLKEFKQLDIIPPIKNGNISAKIEHFIKWIVTEYNNGQNPFYFDEWMYSKIDEWSNKKHTNK